MKSESKSAGYLSSAQERANRIREIRKVFGLSRPKFAARLVGIKPGTLQNWEEARHGGLSERGAKALVEALKQHGFSCTPEWLMFGAGPSPLSHNSQPRAALSAHLENLTEERIIAEELKVFYQLNANAADAIITDESMLPEYKAGDHVAGRRLFGDDIKNAINKVCIVQTQHATGSVVRVLTHGSQTDLFTLTALNAHYKNEIIKDVPVFSVAPVVWIRRRC